MRFLTIPLLALTIACSSTSTPRQPPEPDRWSGTYRYGGTRTELAWKEGYFRFSDARLGRFFFRYVDGGFLEDDTPSKPVRVFPDVRDDTSGSDRPYRSLRLVFRDDDLMLLRVP